MRFNTTQKRRTKTRNYQAELVWKMNPELELYTAVVTASLSKTFYESVDDRLTRIRSLIAQVNPIFVAKLAVYAREQMNLRSIPLVLTVELARLHGGDDLVYRLTKRVIQRADEITELLAYYQLANNRKYNKKLNRLSKQLQKGIAAAFHHFDEYQFAKYNRQTAVSFKDAMFLTHPKARNEAEQLLFKKIIEDTLEVPYTWEVELSRLGQQTFKTVSKKQRAIRQKWEELITSKRLGYMALLRNLRNIISAGVSQQHIKLIVDRLSNPEAVRRSRQLPFRFLAAYLELKEVYSPYTGLILEALEAAVQLSIRNVKGFGISTRVCLASDVSGSMMRSISKKSSVQTYDIGLLLSMLLRSRSKTCITGIFGDRWMPVNFSTRDVLSQVKQLKKIEGKVGYSTNGYTVIDDLISKKLVMHKVMFFTDLQLWDSQHGGNSLQASWSRYKQMAPNARLYLFDLAGYGNSPVSLASKDVYLIAGWSEKVFDVLHAIDKGKQALSMIEKIDL